MFEDFTIFLFVVAGFLGSVGLYHLLRRWWRVWRILVITGWAFLVSSGGGIVTRTLFNDLARGAAFSRIFTGILIIYGIYAFTMFAQERGRSGVH